MCALLKSLNVKWDSHEVKLIHTFWCRCVLLNFLACFWYYIATLEGLENSWLTDVGALATPESSFSAVMASTLDAVTHLPINGLRVLSRGYQVSVWCAGHKNLVHESAARQWVASVYFVTMTLTTVSTCILLIYVMLPFLAKMCRTSIALNMVILSQSTCCQTASIINSRLDFRSISFHE